MAGARSEGLHGCICRVYKLGHSSGQNISLGMRPLLGESHGAANWLSGAVPCPADFPAGTLLGGRYEVVELLGQGSSGVTYRCRDTDGGRDVAVKCLSLRRQVGRRG